ncbi:unnamed protein product, partial [marine sediment metagenome]
EQRETLVAIKTLHRTIDYLVHRDGYPNEDKERATIDAIRVISDAQNELRDVLRT